MKGQNFKIFSLFLTFSDRFFSLYHPSLIVQNPDHILGQNHKVLYIPESRNLFKNPRIQKIENMQKDIVMLEEKPIPESRHYKDINVTRIQFPSVLFIKEIIFSNKTQEPTHFP